MKEGAEQFTLQKAISILNHDGRKTLIPEGATVYSYPKITEVVSPFVTVQIISLPEVIRALAEDEQVLPEGWAIWVSLSTWGLADKTKHVSQNSQE